MTKEEKSATINKAFETRYTQENHPESIPKELAEQLMQEVGYNGVGPIHAAYGRWKKKAFNPKPKSDPTMDIFKLQIPQNGTVIEMTLISRSGRKGFFRANQEIKLA